MIWLQLVATLLLLLMGGIVLVFLEDNHVLHATLAEHAVGAILMTVLVLLAVWWPR